jgi:hypothetical protein
MLTFMQDLTDFIFGTPSPDSNEALRRWLRNNPDKDIDDYLLLQ